MIFIFQLITIKAWTANQNQPDFNQLKHLKLRTAICSICWWGRQYAVVIFIAVFLYVNGPNVWSRNVQIYVFSKWFIFSFSCVFEFCVIFFKKKDWFFASFLSGWKTWLTFVWLTKVAKHTFFTFCLSDIILQMEVEYSTVQAYLNYWLELLLSVLNIKASRQQTLWTCTYFTN